MSADGSPYLTLSFILGSFFLGLTAFGYVPVVNQFYYGGGWPFVQIVFLAFYIIGFRAIRRSAVPGWVKWLLYVAPVVCLVAMQWKSLTL
jgi:hypothetical protein